MNRTEARDIIFAFGTEAWNDACAAEGLTGQIRYQGIDEAEPDQGSLWARLTLRTATEEQETLRGTDTRRFLTVGIVFAQLFVPRQGGEAQALADRLAEFVRNRFRDPRVDDNLEFTQAAIDDNIPPEPSWLAVTVTARFWYRQFL